MHQCSFWKCNLHSLVLHVRDWFSASLVFRMVLQCWVISFPKNVYMSMQISDKHASWYYNSHELELSTALGAYLSRYIEEVIKFTAETDPFERPGEIGCIEETASEMWL